MEDVMYDPPAYLWAIIIAGPTAVAALTCVVLYGGAVRADLGRRRAALLAAAAGLVFGGWLAASAVIAGQGWYRTLPWFPVAVAGYLGLLLALRRVPVVARALAAPGMASRLELPHAPRVAGVAFLLYLALGHLPALFALPAGLGDIAAGIAAPLAARMLAGGTGRRARLVVQRVRHHRPGRGPDPGRAHRVRAAQRHPLQYADRRAAARADPDSDRAAAARPALHGHVRAGEGSAGTATRRRSGHCHRGIAGGPNEQEQHGRFAAAGPGAGDGGGMVRRRSADLV
jgi:hypothetical protein